MILLGGVGEAAGGGGVGISVLKQGIHLLPTHGHAIPPPGVKHSVAAATASTVGQHLD